MERKYVCPCGLTCCDCMFYKTEIYDAARTLRDVIKKHQVDQFLYGNSTPIVNEALNKHFKMSEEQYRDELGNNLNTYQKIPEFMAVLNNMVDLQCHATCYESGGCSMAGSAKACGALKCIQLKGYEGCWECKEYEACEHLDFLKKGYGDVIVENLSTIRDKGFDAIQSRGNQYYAWQRRQKD